MPEYFDGEEPNDVNQAFERLKNEADEAKANGVKTARVNADDILQVLSAFALLYRLVKPSS